MDSINIRNTRNKRERCERSSLFSILHSGNVGVIPVRGPVKSAETLSSIGLHRRRNRERRVIRLRHRVLFRLIARSLASHQSRPARLGSRRRPPRVGRDLNSRVIQRGRPSPPFRSRGRSLSVTPAYGRYATPSSSACPPRDPAPRATRSRASRLVRPARPSRSSRAPRRAHEKKRRFAKPNSSDI